ncbi:MAG: DUF1993 family protein [Roseateles sp.]|uniref:DUF1993 family protein n=1 Tax=Roseateles sp. TaxID=1971397 RepID=UPI0039EC27E0
MSEAGGALALAIATPAERHLRNGDPIVVERVGHRRRFLASAFVDRYVTPNAYFHLAMIHALLRACGARVGKADFEGPPVYTVD